MVPAGKTQTHRPSRSRAEGDCGACVLGRAHHKRSAEMRETIWTDEKVKMLEALLKEKLSASQIGERLGVSRNAVIGKAHRLNMKLRPRPEASAARRVVRHKPSAPVGLWRDLAFVAPIRNKDAIPVEPFLRPDGQMHDTLSIGQKHCKWIVEGNGKNARYCGHEAVPKRSWCEYHMAKLLVAPKQDKVISLKQEAA